MTDNFDLMYIANEFAPEDLPDLPHARQLRAGIPWLSFSPDLEHEFRRANLDESLVHIRANLCLAIMIVVAFTAANAMVLGVALNRIPSKINILVILPVMLVTLAATFSPRRHEVYPPLAIGAAVICGLSQVVIQIIVSLGGVAFLFPFPLSCRAIARVRVSAP